MGTQIKLSNDPRCLIVDVEDFERVSKCNWSLSGITLTSIQGWANGKITSVWSYILDYYGPNWIDHKDRDIFNNQKDNLRVVTPSENSMNRGIASNNTSGYKGVCFEKERNKYKAYIKVGNKKMNLGRFEFRIEAAKAYNRAAILYFGEYACLNKL